MVVPLGTGKVAGRNIPAIHPLSFISHPSFPFSHAPRPVIQGKEVRILKKMFLALLALVMLTILVAACGGGGDEGKTSTGSSTWDEMVWDQDDWA